MAFYYGSWFILFSPLFSFAVIVFGTRIWDVLVRPNDAAQVDPMPGGPGGPVVPAHLDAPIAGR